MNRLKRNYEYILIKLSGEFDQTYYLETYPDVKQSGISPLKHFCNYGWKEGRNPSSVFDTSYYLSTYLDVRDARINPLLHYIRHGRYEGRRPNAKGFVKKHHSIFAKTIFLLQDAKEKPYLVSKLIYELRHNGLKRTISKTKFFLRKNLTTTEILPEENIANEHINRSRVIPYYIDPVRGEKIEDFVDDLSLAVHVFADSAEKLQILLPKLKPFGRFDLYLCVDNEQDIDLLREMVVNNLPNVQNLSLKPAKLQTGILGSMVLNFSKELLEHEIIAHLTTEQESVFSLLVDNEGRYSGEIVRLLNDDVKLVFAQDHDNQSQKFYNNYENEEKIKDILQKFFDDIDSFEKKILPKNGMFWAKTSALKKFLTLPIQKIDFDQNLADDILQGMILLSSLTEDGKIYCIYEGDTLQDYYYYEEQEDFSQKIIEPNVKVLSYYLGQFHPIPENDEWHGKGFTEWTNVKSAYPLYEGHYQQHIPHKDIGYYLLDNPDILRKQAQMMKKSGVYGQIFYHYWFTGKLILEKPAQMLLDNKDIDMPFCFCWANENWTKRWDGNDAEILLGQEYSAEDARAFIRYLIPFFQDERYIKIDDRPMLYVYRPSSIVNAKEYIDIWKQECEKASLKAPYVVAVLTRGATDPCEHYMDAGVERILHDWTAGAVPEMKNVVSKYHDLTGSILSYDEVASFYEKQNEKKDFVYFRSISPMWDNTARYKEGAYVLDKPSPERFQKWLEKLITYTKNTLQPKEQFLILNAWNEWAEGAHVEPDTYHGYAYLNSIGRALSGQSYESDTNVSITLPSLTVEIMISEQIVKELRSDTRRKYQFLQALKQSTIFNNNFRIVSDDEELINLNIERKDNQNIDYKIVFQKFAIFESEFLENLLMSAFRYSSSKIIPNTYSATTIYEITDNGSVDAKLTQNAPVYVYKNEVAKNVKMRTDAKCFVVGADKENKKGYPEVTTIIRFHKNGDLKDLRQALFSLAAMNDVTIIPMIAAQDIDEDMKKAMDEMISIIPFKKDTKVEIRFFESKNGKGDLRTTMLNESLKSVKTKYVAFLDYDDLMFANAYSYLISRLQSTNKAVAFGRVYETWYDSKKGLIVKRERKFEYGYSYTDFLGHNHAPLNSFMLDTTQFDFSKLVYYDDQKYMEDYLLTLQLFTKENADWDGLAENVYIGDYIHSIDRNHTLAFANDDERSKLLSDPEYQKDDKRISDMRNRVM